MQKKFPILLQESYFDQLFSVASEHDFNFSKKCENPVLVPFMTKDVSENDHNWLWQQCRLDHNARVKEARRWVSGEPGTYDARKAKALSGSTTTVSKLHYRPAPKNYLSYRGAQFMQISVCCNKCPTCVDRRKKHWQIRINKEFEQADVVALGTLTYENDNYDQLISLATKTFEPWGPKTPLFNTPEGAEYKNQLILGESPEWLCHLDKTANRDLQLYLERCKHKRLKAHSKGIYQQSINAQDMRYLAVSELGSKSRRFHFHILVFFMNPAKRVRIIDLKYNWSHQRQHSKKIAEEKGIVYENRGRDFRGLGFADFKLVKKTKRDQNKAAKYVVKYIQKDNIGSLHKSHHIGQRVWDPEHEKFVGPKDAPANENVAQTTPPSVEKCDNIVDTTVTVEQFQDQPRQSPKRALNCWDAKKAGLEMPNQAVYDQYPQDLRICLERGSIEGHYIEFETKGGPLDHHYPKFLKMRLAVYYKLGQRSLRPEDVHDKELLMSLFRLPESDFKSLDKFLRIRFGQLGIEDFSNLPTEEEVNSDIPF